MMKIRISLWFLCGISLIAGRLGAQSASSTPPTSDLRLRLVLSQSNKHHSTPAVIWLEPVATSAALTFVPQGHYALLQKNRTFVPHLQVIPVGTTVQFPNADPFFHNVFSMFDGKRFDLGLYEAGSTKSVTFSREGISYIFCNIHPEMSAVVLALDTPFYAVADQNEAFRLTDVPPGDYRLHVWIEGVPQSVTDPLTRRVHLPQGIMELGALLIPAAPAELRGHPNKFGQAYDPSVAVPYKQ